MLPDPHAGYRATTALIAIAPTLPNLVLAFAGVLALILVGRYFVRYPEKMYQIFSFGQAPNPYAVKFFRIVGWAYICGGSVAGLLLLVGTILLWIRSH
jgi:hypothetical protein